MPQGYGYGNARLRAMRSRLLTEIDYNSLLLRTNIEELITALAETPYRQEIETALIRTEGVNCIFQALRANLTQTLHHLRQFFAGKSLLLVNLLLRRWDRHNLLTILRGQKQEVSPESVIAAVVPVGQLDDVSLRELARQPGLRAAIDLMVAWRLPYARVLRQAQAQVDPTAELDQLELALNRFHYASLWEALEPGNGNCAIVLEHLRTEVDLINLSTTLRLTHISGITPLVGQRYDAGDIRPLLIEKPGHLPVQQLIDLVSAEEGPERVVRELSDTRYAQALAAGWQRYQAGEDGLAVLERELERWQAEQTAAMFTRNPLTIAIPIGYIGCKEIEVANLRLIAQAVSLEMDRDRVRRDLIIL